MGSVTAGLVVITGLFLLTAYCMRTRALERRVKAMDTYAGDPGSEETNAARQQNKPWAPTIQEIPGQKIQNGEYSHHPLQVVTSSPSLERIQYGRPPWRTRSTMRTSSSSWTT